MCLLEWYTNVTFIEDLQTAALCKCCQQVILRKTVEVRITWVLSFALFDFKFLMWKHWEAVSPIHFFCRPIPFCFLAMLDRLGQSPFLAGKMLDPFFELWSAFSWYLFTDLAENANNLNLYMQNLTDCIWTNSGSGLAGKRKMDVRENDWEGEKLI